MATLNNRIRKLYGGKVDNSKYLTFTANTVYSTLRLNSGHIDSFVYNNRTYTVAPEYKCPEPIALEYSTNGIIWHPYVFTNVLDENDNVIGVTGQIIELVHVGDYVMLRAASDNRFRWVKFHPDVDILYQKPTGWYQFAMTGSISASGDIMTLLYKGSASSLYHGSFYKLFRNCTALTKAPYLSATNLKDKHHCYDSMFFGCTHLTEAEFTDGTIDVGYGADTFSKMFYDCTSLVRISNLTIILSGYVQRLTFTGMFDGCTALSVVPKIKINYTNAQTVYALVGNTAYKQMFYGCASIVDASELELHNPTVPVYADNRSTFEGCTSLQYPPVIPGGFLNGYPGRYTNSCDRFFKDCSSLKEIVLDHAPITNYTGFTSPTWGWVDGVSETGDFFKRENFPLIRCKHMIPLKWRVHNIDSRPLCFEAETAGGSIQLRKVGEPDEVPFEYSTDGTNWQKYDFSYISLPNIGDKVYFRCSENSNKYNSTYKGSGHYYRFYRSGGTFKVSGNLFTLLKRNGDKIFTVTSSDRAFVSLFSSAGITSMPTLQDYGVYGERMLLNIFYGNENFVNKSVELKFRNAKFRGRTFYNTFNNARISEVTVDILEALFIGETSASPFDHTFSGCSNLQKIKVRFSSWLVPQRPTTNKCRSWVDGVAENGVFVCPKTLEEIHDVDHIPVGWTVKRWYEEMGEQYPSVAALMQQYPDLEDVVDTYPEVAQFLDQYPNLVHSLVNTGSTPYMKMYGDGMGTDVYPHELMEMIATFETSSNPYSIDFGILADYKTKFEISMRYNTSSDFYDRVAFGDVTPAGTTHFQLSDGKHTISVSKNGAFADGTQMTGNSIKIGNWMDMTEASNNLIFPGPITINKTRTFGLGANVAGENKFYELVLKEDSIVTHRFVPIANRVIADIGDLDNIKIYQCAIANANQTEQRTSVFGLV